MPQPATAERLLALPAVLEMTTFSRSTVYALIAKGKFPAPIALGPNRVAWRLSDIAEWIDAKISASR